METFTQVFGALLLFVYQCFDRVMINAYLSALTRPENVVYFFRQVRKVPRLTKQVLAQPTTAYQAWVEAFAKQQQLPLQWAERGVRKEDAVRPYLEQMEHALALADPLATTNREPAIGLVRIAGSRSVGMEDIDGVAIVAEFAACDDLASCSCVNGGPHARRKVDATVVSSATEFLRNPV